MQPAPVAEETVVEKPAEVLVPEQPADEVETTVTESAGEDW